MTHSSKSAYARFIPKEEIDAVATWRFANVDGTPHPDEVVMPPAPSPEAIAADTEALRKQSYEEGYADGHEAGCEETKAELEAPSKAAAQEATERFDALLSDMRQRFTAIQEEMAQSVLAMACDLARQVVRRELSIDPESVKPVVAEAVAQLIADAQAVTVRLHPDDFAALEAGWTTPPAPGSPRFVPDPSVTQGGCLVETTGNVVDATLETRWARTIANLGISSAWEKTDDVV